MPFEKLACRGVTQRQGGERRAGGAEAAGGGLRRLGAAQAAVVGKRRDGGAAGAERGKGLGVAIGGPAGEVGEGDIAGEGGRASGEDGDENGRQAAPRAAPPP